jgi:protein-S-isoprenylcysteine O-methyltransferase Ste14
VPSAAARLFAWSGAVLFACALVYFLFAYGVTFGEIMAGAFFSGAVVADVVLFTLFALHHSVFARGPVRAWVARHFPPYLERSAYVWIASVLFIIVCTDWQYVQGVAWYVDGSERWALYLVQAAGIALTVYAAAALDAFELAGIRQLDRRPAKVEYKTTGPYGWVRHPIYSGWMLIVWAAPLMTMTRLVFAAVSCAYLLIAIPLEERSLRATSTVAYERYARLVRWKLVPYVF